MNSRVSQKIAFTVLFLSALVTILPVLLIIVVIVKNGISAISWEFLTAAPTNGMRSGGIFPAIVGTFYLALGATAISLPLGVMGGIYLSEYSKDNMFTRILKLGIVNLAGVPSIVYGLFGLSLFVIYLKFGVSLISGCLTLAIMELPSIITATQAALHSVPRSFREVSLSLGATKWQTIRHSVLPHALPGIITGAVLSNARITGETAPILFTVAAFYLPHLPSSVLDQVMALPYHLYVISTQIPGISKSTTYGTALVLIVFTLSLNLFGIILRTYLRRQKKW
ncbi:MAG: phosphate ABC transporter, permease protein PstA [Elusimicrobia bacterium RIFOXYB2_FULL_48_7]|nr:MAG: phosphate ABC transporter, permease protein PstA [Elusimicrobia bacterium RIFOXYB2_FULL_48_7]